MCRKSAACGSVIAYTRFYTLSTHDTNNIPNQQSSSIVINHSQLFSIYPSTLPTYNDDTTLPKKSRKKKSRVISDHHVSTKKSRKKTTIIHTNHVSSADTVTISSTSCNSTQYNLSSKSLHTTISPVFEREKNEIVSLASKSNNITSEGSNNSNYMGEQSWLISNKTSTTKYPQGYNYSTQAICQNPIVDDRYVNNHVPPNIYSPSTATNQTSNNFQTLVYNYQNEHNTPPTADSIKDDWWTDLSMLQDYWLQHTLCDQNDSDSLTEDRMQKNYKFKLPFDDHTTLSKEPRKEDRVNTYHVSSAEAVTISSQSLYTTSSPIPPIFERDKNEIVSLASKSNNITSEGSNNSNYMGEQSWLISNKTSTTEYQHGYDCSTQNPIVNKDYSCVNNHVTQNIYSPSTATNTRSNNFQTEVYNCKNGSNTPYPADITQDDWWTDLCTLLQDN